MTTKPILLLPVVIAVACSTTRTTSSATIATTEIDVTSTTAFDETAALADGHISVTEYESATEIVVACLTAAGLKVIGPSWDDDRRFFSYIYTSDNPARVAAADACETGTGSAVRSAWAQAMHNRIANDPQVWQAFAACLSEVAGYQIPYLGIDHQEELTDTWYDLGPPWVECPHPQAVVAG